MLVHLTGAIQNSDELEAKVLKKSGNVII